MNRFRLLFAPEEDDAPPAQRSRHDWLVDWAIFAIAIAGGGVALADGIQHGLHGTLLAVDVIIGAGVTLALWWRRRWPVALALAMLPLGLLSASAGPAGVFFLYTVAAYRRWQAAVLIVLLGFALLPAEQAVHPQGNSLSYPDLFGGVLFGAVVVAFIVGAVFNSVWLVLGAIQAARLRRSAIAATPRLELVIARISTAVRLTP